VPMPYSPSLEAFCTPDAAKLVEAVRKLLKM
jgi:pyruvate/2-oxoglutarate/acetoin dehydrogenase E1 component